MIRFLTTYTLKPFNMFRFISLSQFNRTLRSIRILFFVILSFFRNFSKLFQKITSNMLILEGNYSRTSKIRQLNVATVVKRVTSSRNLLAMLNILTVDQPQFIKKCLHCRLFAFLFLNLLHYNLSFLVKILQILTIIQYRYI